ncbi:hypothetical protein [Orenia metallireducens]|uniref:hypothetical protein n=1 Tax=Orenia metallireducens TaxID=1413210 RepID=UPI000BE3303A|nr:hypothetical protein [Orenia metallireducens]
MHKEDSTTISMILIIVGTLIIVGGVIAGFKASPLGSYIYYTIGMYQSVSLSVGFYKFIVGFTVACSGFVSGIIFIAIAKGIDLLHNINLKLKYSSKTLNDLEYKVGQIKDSNKQS